MAKEKKEQGMTVMTEILPIDEYKVMSPVQLLSRKMAIKQIQDAVMKKDIHYGILPGTVKPTLYKAGADELLGTFNIGRENPVIEDLSTEDEIRYRVTVRLFSRISGKFLGAGIGECSSNEEKYKWRKPVCTQEWDETPQDHRREKWVKDGWDAKKKENIGKKIKQVRTNPSDIANTILKMADKRGYVHTCISVLGISDLFEQDLEDLEENTREHILAEGRAAQVGKPEVTQPEQRVATPPAPQETKEQSASDGQATSQETNNVKVATAKQVELIRKNIKAKGITEADVTKAFKLANLESLPFGMVNDVLGYIYNYKG